MAFPVSPTNGQQSVVNGITYQYSSATNSWTRVPGIANTISASGNVTAGNLITTGNGFVGELFVTTASGGEGGQINLAPAVTGTTLVGNIVIDVHNDLLRFFENGGTNRGAYIDLANASSGIGSNLLAGGGGTPTQIVNGTSNVVVAASSNVTVSVAGTANVATFTTTGLVTTALSSTGNTTTGNLLTNGLISATGNITGGNLLTSGRVSATGNVSSGNLLTSGRVSATGNVTGGNAIVGNVIYVGNGATTTPLTNPILIARNTGATYVQVAVVNTSGDGSADFAAYANNGDETQGWMDMGITGNAFSDPNYTVTGSNDGYIFAQGNASFGGNLIIATGDVGTTSDIVFATGGFKTANIKARLINSTGAFSVGGNIIGSNITTAGQVSASGNITGSYFIGNGSQLTGLPASYSNANVQAYLPTYTGNLVALTGNVTTTANVDAGNLRTSGLISATGNVTGGNLRTSGLISATGNVTGGNILTGGLISATGNVTGGNILTGGLISATGNITVGNLTTAGNVTADGMTMYANSIGSADANMIIDPGWGGLTTGNVIILGNLDVKGSVTIIESTTVTTNELVLEVANAAATATAASGAGIAVGPLGSAYASWVYGFSANAWLSNIGISAVGTVIGGNVTTSGLVSAVGNVIGGNLTTVGQLISTITTGTAPLVVSSTTKVTNLNVEQVDGYHAATANTVSTIAVRDASANIVANVYNGVGVSVTGTVTGASVVGGVITGSSVSVTGNITGGNILGGANVNATLHSGTTVSVTGNITGGNILGGANVNATLFSGTTVSVTGNASANYFIGNGSLLTGVNAGLKWTTVANTAPLLPAPGDFWYNSYNSVKYQYTNDGTGNTWVDQSFPTVFTTLTTNQILNGGANGTGNIGTAGGTFNTVFAKSTSAQYADLAENYTADDNYPPATVVVFGGEQEITISTTVCDTRVAGVVSTNPAFLMNSEADGVPVALTGRVPCLVKGPITKGDLLITSDIPGTAQRLDSNWSPGCVIGKSLENIDDLSIKTIEVVVGRF